MDPDYDYDFHLLDYAPNTNQKPPVQSNHDTKKTGNNDDNRRNETGECYWDSDDSDVYDFDQVCPERLETITSFSDENEMVSTVKILLCFSCPGSANNC